MTESPDLCRDCGGNCCRHPNMTKEEYQRLVDKLGFEKVRAAKPKRVGAWLMFMENCPGKLPDGCILSYEERPLGCRIYPFVAIPALGGSVLGHELLLDLRHCPHWKEFGDQYEAAKREFEEVKKKETLPETKVKQSFLTRSRRKK
jgi:Fe-S-cluster containining protein